MTIASHTALSSASRIVTGGMLLGGVVDAVADSVALHRAERAIANASLADRLAIVRAAEQEALRTARDLAAELARTRRELAEERAYSRQLADALSRIDAASR